MDLQNLPRLSNLPGDVIKVSSIQDIEDLSAETAMPVFTYSHQINPTLTATWYLVLIDKTWFGYVQQ